MAKKAETPVESLATGDNSDESRDNGSEPTKRDESVESLFAKATSDPSKIATVSKYVRVGRRWDVTHKELMNDLLVIHRFKDIQTRYGPACLVDIDHQGQQKTALFGSQVLIDQIHDLGPNLPVIAVIDKPGRAYTLRDPTPQEIEAYKAAYL